MKKVCPKYKALFSIIFFFLFICLSACYSNKNELTSELLKTDLVLDGTPVKANSKAIKDTVSWANEAKREYENLMFLADNTFTFDRKKTVCCKIQYLSGDCKVTAYVAAPKDYKSKNYPVLIFNRGGQADYSAVLPELPAGIAQYGFIVLATQYGGNDGGEGIDEFGGAEVQDVISLIDIAQQLSFASGEIYMMGWSRGAMETYIALSKDTRITAAVAGAGPTDLAKYFNEATASGLHHVLITYIGGSPFDADFKKEYETRSAVNFAQDINTPLLIAHGLDDDKVNPAHSETLYNILIGMGKDTELVLYPEMDHDTPFWAFMEEHLAWLLMHKSNS